MPVTLCATHSTSAQKRYFFCILVKAGNCGKELTSVVSYRVQQMKEKCVRGMNRKGSSDRGLYAGCNAL